MTVCGCCFRVGDAVFGQVMGGMASHVVADARTLVPQPANINAVEASTIPTTFLTAYECLMVAAGIQRGTRVLVHAATGMQPLAGTLSWSGSAFPVFLHGCSLQQLE